MRAWVLISLLLLLGGCSSEPGDRVVGLWSSGRGGQLLDISPSGMYSQVWFESQAHVSTWHNDDDQLVLTPLSHDIPQEIQRPPVRFKEEGLEFIQDEDEGRFLRFVKEKRKGAEPPAELVGIWVRETLTRRKEFLEFTPWGTVCWTRWAGEAGEQKLVGGWSDYAVTSQGELLFFATVEGNELLSWTKRVSYETTSATLEISFPKPLGKAKYTRSSKDDFLKAASQSR